MSTIVRHPHRNSTGLLRAAEAALLRWYPNTPLARIDLALRMQPGYPLIHGGSPRPAFQTQGTR